ncbi:MAG: phosphatase PAP2 family protein [Bacteroidaceae bacterium]|nr:phosphatase PAP2 family protein [Bacteroidaceae bacterium]
MRKSILTIEKVAVGYAVLTSLLTAALWPRLVNPWAMVQTRLWWLLLTVVLMLGGLWVQRRCRNRERLCLTADLARVAGQLVWLRYWYPDIYEFNRICPNLDHLFAAADQWLFGTQPSVTFSRWLTAGLWSELFNLGYWSYFPMIAVLVIAVFWQQWQDTTIPDTGTQTNGTVKQGDTQTVAAVILTAFFLYYLLYLLLPVAGPQFYFQAVGVDEIMAGHFPALGTYFSSHAEMLPAPGNPDGVFYQLVMHSQEAGERPIAAFPSSHIGISTIVMLLSRCYVPWLTRWLLPFWFLLCCATVYIQAHYVVDALAGLLSAPLVLIMATTIAARKASN